VYGVAVKESKHTVPTNLSGDTESTDSYPHRMLELIDIARLEESRQAVGLRDVAGESRPIAGGIMARGAPGSWINNAVNLGLSGPVTRAEIEELIEWHSSVGSEPRAEVAPFVDPSTLTAFADLGFVTSAFESVFFRELSETEAVRPVFDPPPGVSIIRIDPRDAEEVRAYSVAAMSGFFPPGSGPTEVDFEISARCVRHLRTIALAARVGDRFVGAGAMEVSGQVAGLFGLSVLPEFRRQGIQQMLIAERVNLAARAGATLATIGSRPGIGTERNVRRMGFHLAYVKSIMVKRGPGLAPVVG